MALKLWRGTTLISPGLDTGTLEAGDRVRFTDVLYGPIAACYAAQPPRGAFGTSNFNSMGINRVGWVVSQSTVNNMRGGIGKLTIVWEAGGAYATMALPVGDFSLKPQELYPKIERAGCFAGITATTLNIVYNAVYSSTKASGAILGGESVLTTQIADGKNGYTAATYADQLALAQKLLAKLLKGEETFYLAGWRYTYETFSYTMPTVTPGGTPGTPGGPLAGSLPSGVSWLRLADDIDPAGVAGSMYRLNITWLGGPIFGGVGYWDSDVYA
jgi:hypothetical protein